MIIRMSGYLLHELHWSYSTGRHGHGHHHSTVGVNKTQNENLENLTCWACCC